jgi:hypothetical protein
MIMLMTITIGLAAPAVADTITGTAGAGFQSWTGVNLNENGAPYWDNTSLDGSNKNVGFFLTDAPGALPFWGDPFNSGTDAGGTADLNFTFNRSATLSLANLELEVAQNKNLNEFGWYDTTDPLVLHPIFLGPDSAPANDEFSPSADYGFYLKGSNGTFYTQSSLNPGGDTAHQHFSIFQQSSTNGLEVYWLGIEDLSVADLSGAEGSAGDYNDMVVRIAALPAGVMPEPATMALTALGMLGLGSRLRHRKPRRSAAINSTDRRPGFFGLFPRAKSYRRPIVEFGTVVLQESKH